MKINVADQKRIAAALSEVQGPRVSARVISATDIEAEIARIEKKLSNLMYKKDWDGMVIDVDLHAQSFPGAYKGIPESTQFRVKRFPSGWFVTSVKRGRCGGPSQRRYVAFTEAQKSEMVKFIAENF